MSLSDSPHARHQRANAIRALSMDGVQKAKSGHPEYGYTDGVETTTGPL
ncbi:hypothetical protein, partial [Candidatus Symbiopectobacterium sp. PLON1]|nr:hypothetical protein [Candidatus Symbiopectobacterium sp. PLON1]